MINAMWLVLALLLSPPVPEACRGLGPPEAADCVRELVAKTPSADGYLALAGLYADMPPSDAKEKALVSAALYEAVRLAPDRVDVQLEAGSLYLDIGMPREALAPLRAAARQLPEGARQLRIATAAARAWDDDVTTAAAPDSARALSELEACVRLPGRRAAAACTRAVKIGLTPTRAAQAWTSLGEVMLSLDRRDTDDEAPEARAESAWREAIGLDSRAPLPRFLLGDLLTRRGRVADALVEWDVYVALRPEDAMGHRRRAETLGTLGRLEEAAQEQGAALRLDGTAAAEDIAEGVRVLAAGGRTAEAEAQALRLLASAGGTSRLSPHLAAAAQALQATRRGMSRRLYLAAFQGRPREDADLCASIGSALMGLGALEEGLAALRDAVAAPSPNQHVYLNWLASALARAGRPEEGLQALRDYLLHVDDVWNAEGVAEDLMRRLESAGRAAEAVDALRAVARMPGVSCRTHASLGALLVRAGRDAEAVVPLREAVRLQADCPWGPRRVLAKALHHLGKDMEAAALEEAELANLRQLVRQNDMGWHRQLASYLEELGRSEEALVTWEGFVGAHPANAEGHANLALALARLGRHAEADREFAASERADPTWFANAKAARAQWEVSRRALRGER